MLGAAPRLGDHEEVGARQFRSTADRCIKDLGAFMVLRRRSRRAGGRRSLPARLVECRESVGTRTRDFVIIGFGAKSVPSVFQRADYPNWLSKTH